MLLIYCISTQVPFICIEGLKAWWWEWSAFIVPHARRNNSHFCTCFFVLFPVNKDHLPACVFASIRSRLDLAGFLLCKDRWWCSRMEGSAQQTGGQRRTHHPQRESHSYCCRTGEDASHVMSAIRRLPQNAVMCQLNQGHLGAEVLLVSSLALGRLQCLVVA